MAACGQPAPPPAPLAIEDVYTRDTVGSTDNAAVFMTITSPTPDRLLAASTPAAKRTDLMTMRTGGRGGMQMIYMDDINLPAGKPVGLEPGGRHVWLDGLNQPLKAGESFR
jgi:copper(I)-binding protein